jgi:Ca2+-binding RTX toxin-like protein
MTNIVFNIPTDMTEIDIDLSGFAGGEIGPLTATEVDYFWNDGPVSYEMDVFGKKFVDTNADGSPDSGKITGLDLFANTAPIASISKMHMSVETAFNYLSSNDTAGFINALLNGNDHITGSGGDDVLLGLRGRDALDGGGGHDVLVGGLGGDTLTGGAGGDVFFYSSVKDSGKLGVDTITDLGTGDAISLQAIDADTHTDGDQAFHIVDKLKGHAGEMTVVYDSTHDRTIVSLDNTGDGEADGIIWITGDHRDFAGWVF